VSLASIHEDINDFAHEAVKLRKNPVKVTFENVKYEVTVPATRLQEQ